MKKFVKFEFSIYALWSLYAIGQTMYMFCTVSCILVHTARLCYGPCLPVTFFYSEY